MPLPPPLTTHPKVPSKPLQVAEPDAVVVLLVVVVVYVEVVVLKTAAAVETVVATPATLEDTTTVVSGDIAVVADDTYAAVVVTAGITELTVVDAATYTAEVVTNVDVAGKPVPPWFTTTQRVRMFRLIGLTER